MRTSTGRNSFMLTLDTSVDMGNLPTLPERMHERLVQALIFHLRDVCEAVVEDARMQLQPLGHGPGEIVGPHVDFPGGYDTGKLRDSLTYHLVDSLISSGMVAYDLDSEEAEYWKWIEFGHWVTRAKTPWYWQGYHMLENAIGMNIMKLRRAVRMAWSDTMVALAAEARTPMPGMRPGGTSGLLHR